MLEREGVKTKIYGYSTTEKIIHTWISLKPIVTLRERSIYRAIRVV